MILTSCLALALQWVPLAAEAPRRAICTDILAATLDDREQRWLLVVAAEESEFKPAILNCKKRGDHGKAHGAWQVHPHSKAEATKLCARGAAGALVALGRILASEAQCSHVRAAWRHSAYCSGWCTAPNGKRISERRNAKVAASVAKEKS